MSGEGETLTLLLRCRVAQQSATTLAGLLRRFTLLGA